MKRSPALRTLSSEHHTGLVLARRASLAAAGNDVTTAWHDVAHRFATELEPHFRAEESGLLPALAQTGEQAIVERTLAEHAQLRHLVYDQPHTADSLRTFAELLTRHIRFEERELFAAAQARLPDFACTPTDEAPSLPHESRQSQT